MAQRYVPVRRARLRQGGSDWGVNFLCAAGENTISLFLALASDLLEFPIEGDFD